MEMQPELFNSIHKYHIDFKNTVNLFAIAYQCKAFGFKKAFLIYFAKIIFSFFFFFSHCDSFINEKI